MYQLKQAKSYTAEQLYENGNYIFEMFGYEDLIDVIHVKLRSRFTNQLIHNCWIKYDISLKINKNQNPILAWYCDCKAGARVFGMCAHVTSILWYLGVAIFDSNLTKPRLSDLFLRLCIDCSVF